MKYVLLLVSIIFGVDVHAMNFDEVKRRAERDVRSEVSLSRKQIAMVDIAQIASVGDADQAVKVIRRALESKHLSEKEVVLIMTQLTSYIGFFRVERVLERLGHKLNAVEIDLPRDKLVSRHRAGREAYSKLDPSGYDNINAAFGDLAANLPRTTFPMFGDAYSPAGLSLQTRQLVTISTLSAIANAPLQLAFHIQTSLHVGLTHQALMDVAVLTQFNAGMPAAYNLALAVKQQENSKNRRMDSPYLKQ